MRQPSWTITRPVAAGLLSFAVIAAGGIAGSTGAAAATTVPAAARPTGTMLGTIPAPVRERMLAQAPLVDAASVIRTAVEAGPPRGYAGLGLVDDHVALWWQGAPPADITTAVAAAQHIAPVVVEKAAYSGSRLETAAAKVEKVVDADTGDAAHGVRIRTDGSGLDVLVDTSAGAPMPKLGPAEVPTHTIQQRPKSSVSRYDDAAPWSSGTYIQRPDGGSCTSGFGVRDLSTGNPYLMTAGHCGPVGTEWTDRSREVIGTTAQRNPNHDDSLIAVKAAGNRTYIGGTADGVQANVVDWTQVFPGQLLCQSGSTSAGVVGGPICNLEVQFHYPADGENLVEATQLDGYDSARRGDSGGPVYAVTAQGTLLAAGTTTSSAGPGFGFQDFATYRDDFGAIVPVVAGVTGTCRASYQVTNTWSGGYAVNVTVYNSGADINGWQLLWNLPASSQIQGHWNAVFSQNGATATAANESYNARITSGGAVTFGFTASGSPAVPAPITLNGVTCS